MIARWQPVRRDGGLLDVSVSFQVTPEEVTDVPDESVAKAAHWAWAMARGMFIQAQGDVVGIAMVNAAKPPDTVPDDLIERVREHDEQRNRRDGTTA